MFSWQCSIHEMAPFFGGGGVLGPFSPKCGSSLLKFRPAVVSHKTKTVSEHSFKIKCLSGNRTYPKFTNYKFDPFLGLIYPWKTQNIAKKQSFSRNCIFMTIIAESFEKKKIFKNNHYSRSLLDPEN